MTDITIYCDGACSPNPGTGGWGAVIVLCDKELELNGRVGNSTNNQMELLAAIESLKVLPIGSNVTLFTDSQYVNNGITMVS